MSTLSGQQPQSRLIRVVVSGEPFDVERDVLEAHPGCVLPALAAHARTATADGTPVLTFARDVRSFRILRHYLHTGELLAPRDPLEREILRTELDYYGIAGPEGAFADPETQAYYSTAARTPSAADPVLAVPNAPAWAVAAGETRDWAAPSAGALARTGIAVMPAAVQFWEQGFVGGGPIHGAVLSPLDAANQEAERAARVAFSVLAPSGPDTATPLVPTLDALAALAALPPGVLPGATASKPAYTYLTLGPKAYPTPRGMEAHPEYVSTLADFRDTFDIFTNGASGDFFTGLPFVAAGGAVLAALHHWPPVRIAPHADWGAVLANGADTNGVDAWFRENCHDLWSGVHIIPPMHAPAAAAPVTPPNALARVVHTIELMKSAIRSLIINPAQGLADGPAWGILDEGDENDGDAPGDASGSSANSGATALAATLSAPDSTAERLDRLARLVALHCGRDVMFTSPHTAEYGSTSPLHDHLQRYRRSDIDLFLVTRSPDEALTAIIELHERLQRRYGVDVYVARFKGSLEFIIRGVRRIQVILRLYHSAEQVILGFDLDCCAVCYDGTRVLALPRAMRALQLRYNLVDLTRQSTTYETRLVKYLERGFAVAVPYQFDVQSVVTRVREKVADRLLDRTPVPLAGFERLVALAEAAATNSKILKRCLGFVATDYGGGGTHLNWALVRQLRQRDATGRKMPFVLGTTVAQVAGATTCRWHGASCASSVPPVISFQTNAPHTQDRVDLLYTGSFNPVAGAWLPMQDCDWTAPSPTEPVTGSAAHAPVDAALDTDAADEDADADGDEDDGDDGDEDDGDAADENDDEGKAPYVPRPHLQPSRLISALRRRR